MLKTLKFFYGLRSLMFSGCIRSDVVVVRSLIQIKNRCELPGVHVTSKHLS